MIDLKSLIKTLQNEKYIYIQTHNFPDHDAVASAFGLQAFFNNFNINSFLTYEGEIQRDSLFNMINELKIDIKNIKELNMQKDDKIVIVDGCKGNKNVTDLIGDEIGVIDHHQVTIADDVLYNDIRSGYGSCSTIITSYFNDYNFDIPNNVATALLIGLNMDTALLTRGVNVEDIKAYSYLYLNSNITLVNSILRNFIQVKDLQFYKTTINNLKIYNNFCFCYFDEGCNQNMLGILGDFLLSLKEVQFVVLCAKNNNKINFSLRSENSGWNCSLIIQEVLKGIGFGGGHNDMAGGIIENIDLFNEESIYAKFLNILK